jgi:hypothetical protein
VKAAPALTQYRDAPIKRVQQKYHNEKVTTPDGIKFDSKAEYRRWQYLAMLEKSKEIRDLRLQVPFELIPAQVAPNGSKIRPTSYIADFCYLDSNGKFVCEDVKGPATDVWKIKQKLMLQVHRIWVKEIRS